MSLDVLLKWPTRSRPELFKSTFAKWQHRLGRFLVSIDEDDPKCNNPEFLCWLESQANVEYRIGRSGSKIAAINRDLEGQHFDVLVLAADDLIPQRPDYLERMLAYLFTAFPDGDGVVHVNDGRAGVDLNTMPVMGWKYFKRFGYIYHPAYTSLWADNEFDDISRELNRSAYCPEMLVYHAWDKANGADALHQHNESFYEHDKQIYLRRRAQGFDGQLSRPA